MANIFSTHITLKGNKSLLINLFYWSNVTYDPYQGKKNLNLRVNVGTCILKRQLFAGFFLPKKLHENIIMLQKIDLKVIKLYHMT